MPCSSTRCPGRPPPPCPANNKILKKIRSEEKCSFDTHSVPHQRTSPTGYLINSGPKKVRSEEKCLLDKAFVGHGGRGGRTELSRILRRTAVISLELGRVQTCHCCPVWMGVRPIQCATQFPVRHSQNAVSRAWPHVIVSDVVGDGSRPDCILPATPAPPRAHPHPRSPRPGVPEEPRAKGAQTNPDTPREIARSAHTCPGAATNAISGGLEGVHRPHVGSH